MKFDPVLSIHFFNYKQRVSLWQLHCLFSGHILNDFTCDDDDDDDVNEPQDTQEKSTIYLYLYV